MAYLPIPDYTFESVTDISPNFLKKKGVRLLLLDLDNTLAPYGKSQPSPDIRCWIRELKHAGIEPYILSNNRGKRPSEFGAEFGIGYLRNAGKPFTSRLTSLLRQKKVNTAETALAGDQIFSDILCARRAGITSIIVRPVHMRNPLILLRFGLEYPFRAAGKRKQRGRN